MTELEAESGAQLIARLTSQLRPQIEKLDEIIFPNNGPHPREIAEISGEADVGKTTLLMHIMARVILPTTYGGKDGMVLFLQTDNNFDFIKFMEILEKLIRESDAMDDSLNIFDVVKESLVNITFKRCFNWEQFEIGILGLDSFFSSNNRYCLLTVDSISAFYWMEVSDTNKIRMETHMKNILRKLKRVVDDHSIVLVYTKSSFVNNQCSNAVSLADYVMELAEQNKPNEESGISKFTYKMYIPSTNFTYFANYNFESQGINWEK